MGTIEDIATSLSNYVLAFSRKELEVPQTSAMPRELKNQVEQKLKALSENGQIYEQIISHSDKSLLVIDAKATIARERKFILGSIEHTINIKGSMRYFEATTDKSFQELCEVSRRRALSQFSSPAQD